MIYDCTRATCAFGWTSSQRRTDFDGRSLGNVEQPEVDARKFGNEYVSDPVTPGYVQSVCQTGKGQGVKRKRDGIDKPPLPKQASLDRSAPTLLTSQGSLQSNVAIFCARETRRS
jgi:hypothetical protein